VNEPTLYIEEDRLFKEHPALVFPHKNELSGQILEEFNVSCDACNRHVPAELLHGTIADHPECTEVRYIGPCDPCRRIIHNTCRVYNDGRMRLLIDGEVCVTAPRPWWRRLASWAFGPEPD